MPKINNACGRLSAILLCLFVFYDYSAYAADAALSGTFTMFKPGASINSKVESVIDRVLSLNKKGKAIPSATELAPILEYMVVADGSSRSPHPEKRSEGVGIFWRQTIDKSFDACLRYFYNPKISSELLYPAAIRRGYLLPDSEVLNLEKPLWAMLGEFAETPRVLRNNEYEEITPDDFSGSYYVYKQNNMMLLFRYKNTPMIMSITWQDGKSETGKKGGFVPPYSNWDFVFTKDEGGTATGLGWMSTYMYASSAITLIFPVDDKTTGYSMFKWLKAGWSGMNVVKRSHILSGADRNFAGMMTVMDNKKGVSAEHLEAINSTAHAYDRASMLKLLEPYSQELARLSKNDDILERDEFQTLLSGGKYIQGLTDDELRSLIKLNMLKRKLGKPVLGG